jgi:uncharacterized membrane protein HdeD (DUF308 family)
VTPEHLAYRDQMRTIAWPLRLCGLLSIMAGCGALIAFRYAHIPWLMIPGLAFLVLGWALHGYATWLRTQWAKANPYKGPR